MSEMILLILDAYILKIQAGFHKHHILIFMAGFILLILKRKPILENKQQAFITQ